MQLFYNPDINEETTEIAFSKEESRHMVKVLRKSSGNQLQITNGKGWLFLAEIIIADMKNCVATILSKSFETPRSYRVHLAVAPTKMNDRYEWLLEKATEIGVDVITPIICEHSERKIIKIDRFEKILQSAMKQSLHYYMPELQEAISFSDFISQAFNGQKLIAHCEKTERMSLKQVVQPSTDVLLLIGPEGDFSAGEIELAIKAGFKPVTLGNTRLRTETAAMVACHSVVFINEQ